MAEALQVKRARSWASGRERAARALQWYQTEYGVAIPPAPAKIIDELLTDYLGASLSYDPLPQDTFAKVCWRDGQPVVTVNARISLMANVKDHLGVEAVAKCHELVHIQDDGPMAESAPQGLFPGFEAPTVMTCFRSVSDSRDEASRQCEIQAEEIGRAFAVSWSHLERSGAFQALLRFAGRPAPRGEAWRLVYESAADLGISATSLVRQLTLEGCIALVKEDGKPQLYIQPGLLDRVRTA